LPSAAFTSDATTSARPSSFLLAAALAAVLFVWSLNYVIGKITLARLDALTHARDRISSRMSRKKKAALQATPPS